MLVAVRVSLSPGPGLPELDLELGVGTTLGALRGHLAEAARVPAARTAAVWAAGVELDYIVPDYVHVLSAGRIVKSGGKELALELEAKGYSWIESSQQPVGA